MKLLIIEDDPKIAGYIAQGFGDNGDSAEVVANGEDALSMALAGDYDLLIVDVMLPGRDGLSLIEELRASGCQVPVIILSAKRSVEDRVRGLQTGSDDYLTKPFSFTELLARTQALLRRAQQQADHGISARLYCQDLCLDPMRKTVTRADQTLVLQPREFQLLEYFLRNQGRVLSKTLILQHVWDYNFDPQTNVVDVLVCRLRAKIDKEFSVKLLHTLRGVGYVLKAD